VTSATVAETVGRTLVQLGVTQVFGVVGSGNFHVTNAMLDVGARYLAARHEAGAATMADAYARVSGEVAALSLHQGCGLTNATTGITEAAKSRTPLLILAGEPAASATTSNFRIDQDGLGAAVGVETRRVTSPATAVRETVEAYGTALHDRRTVLLNLPLDVQAATVPDETTEVVRPPVAPTSPAPSAEAVAQLTDVLAAAERPVMIAGRGARHAGPVLRELGAVAGALLATSAVAKGLFRGDAWDLDVAGGFSTPTAAELIRGADVVIGFGCGLNMWTTRHGRLLAPEATLVQVDLDRDALGRHRPITLGIVADTALAARAVSDALGRRDGRRGTNYRTAAVSERLRARRRWRDERYDDWGGDGRIDPRTLTIGLDDLLPAERVVATDSGNFMGFPAMFLEVPDEHGFCFTQSYQSVGLGLATAIGAGLAQPDRVPVAAVGDGGLLMAASELDTIVRSGLPMVVIVYDDGAYGAEVHHFGTGARLDTVTFPPTDHAAIARGYGFDALTVRAPDDLAAVRAWVDGPRDRPLLIDAKIASPMGSWWLEEAFRGH
jgi:acetolactate synthase I/II/III large subunit